MSGDVSRWAMNPTVGTSRSTFDAYLKEHPEIEHGDIRIAFNPDEEIGKGAHKIDVERFGADWAYTMALQDA